MCVFKKNTFICYVSNWSVNPWCCHPRCVENSLGVSGVAQSLHGKLPFHIIRWCFWSWMNLNNFFMKPSSGWMDIFKCQVSLGRVKAYHHENIQKNITVFKSPYIQHQAPRTVRTQYCTHPVTHLFKYTHCQYYTQSAPEASSWMTSQ